MNPRARGLSQPAGPSKFCPSAQPARSLAFDPSRTRRRNNHPHPPFSLLYTHSLANMAKIKERGKTGAAKNYITRNQALKKCVAVLRAPSRRWASR